MFKFDPNSTEKQGRWRLRSPSEFGRMWTRHDLQAKGISYIVGLLCTSAKTQKRANFAIQSIRFDRSFWTEKKAAGWWKKNKSRFKKYWTAEDWKKRWKEPKQVKLQRRNPPQNVNLLYTHLLLEIFISPIPRSISEALYYYKFGESCETCRRAWDNCRCEGGREFKLDAEGNRITEPCEGCDLNFCMCNYDIWDDNFIIQRKKIMHMGWELAKETLTPPFMKKLLEWLASHGFYYENGKLYTVWRKEV